MNNIEAYNTELGNGAPFEQLEHFQAEQKSSPPVCSDGRPPAADADGICPDGNPPSCTAPLVLNQDTGMCDPAAAPVPQAQTAAPNPCTAPKIFDPTTEMCVDPQVSTNAVGQAATTTQVQTPGVPAQTPDVAANPAANTAVNTAVDPSVDVAADMSTGAVPPVDKPATTEPFFGGNSLNMDLLLKALVFGCLFFILAHNDTRKMLVNLGFLRSLRLKAGDDNSLLILMGVFIICYMLLSRYVL